MLLQIVAGEADATSAAAAALGRDPEMVRRAAEFFVEQVLLDPGSDHYRVLGCGPKAATTELRRNMAMMLRWLHPDIGENAMRSVYAGRVTAAWESLKTTERRHAYDEAMSERAKAAVVLKAERGATAGPSRSRRAHALKPVPSQGHGHGLEPSRPLRPGGFFRRLLMSLVPGGRR